uniref:Uncharacterized protein n=1 Tax=Megaselia scalaris TaxID=36166 RepID=T1H0N8_MEGSC
MYVSLRKLLYKRLSAKTGDNQLETHHKIFLLIKDKVRLTEIRRIVRSVGLQKSIPCAQFYLVLLHL